MIKTFTNKTNENKKTVVDSLKPLQKVKCFSKNSQKQTKSHTKSIALKSAFSNITFKIRFYFFHS